MKNKTENKNTHTRDKQHFVLFFVSSLLKINTI
jgi:hypothetical protein